MAKIVFLDAETVGEDIDLSLFKKFGEFVSFSKTPKDKTVERVSLCDIAITNKVVIDKEVMDNAPNLKLICVAATGTNNIDLEYARLKKIAVSNVAGYSTRSVLEMTFALFFYLSRHLSYYDSYVKSSNYSKSPIFTHLGMPYHELFGKVWGIIGLGTIGRSVAEVAKSFGCEVIYFSTTGKNFNPAYKRVSLDELLKISDVVSIHAPLNDKTYNLITYEKIKLMKKTAILLNLGRGGIVNEKDLARAIDEELISGAGLDVLENEPILSDNPLLKVKNRDRLIITPHIAWASKEARSRLINEIVLNIEAFLEGRKRNRIV